MPRFYLTTAIDYVNSRPHLGTAYEKIAADVIARYKRLAGFDVQFVMGNDEHSQNVFRRARELGLDPLAYCDRMEQEFRDVWARARHLVRRLHPHHAAAAPGAPSRRSSSASHDAGDIYEGEYEGWYCVSCEAFKQEKDLVDGLCPIHRTKPEWIKERNYFFRLSAYRDRAARALRASIRSSCSPRSRRNEILRLLEGGLDDISVSRAGQSWGIPLPFDPSSVVYVWFDALINYASAVGFGTDDGAVRHVVAGGPARDRQGHHAVPLRDLAGDADERRPAGAAAGVRPRLGARSGEKMSKSLGTVVDPLEAAERLRARPAAPRS